MSCMKCKKVRNVIRHALRFIGAFGILLMAPLVLLVAATMSFMECDREDLDIFLEVFREALVEGFTFSGKECE